MYPDLITPKSHPQLLTAVDYDPLKVMPATWTTTPTGPRVYASAAHFERCRERIAAGQPIDVACLAKLVEACDVGRALPALESADDAVDDASQIAIQVASHNRRIADAHRRGFLNGVAFHLTHDDAHLAFAIDAMTAIADAMDHPHAGRSTPFTEPRSIAEIARLYDLIAGADPFVTGTGTATDTGKDTDARFRKLLAWLPDQLDLEGHRHCNNHNIWNVGARLAVGLALQDPQVVHDALYGCHREDHFRYGLLHQLRHDYLADGMQWEGSMSYHMVVCCDVVETLTMLEYHGVDLWHRPLPNVMQDEGCDEHRSWGPKGEKSVKAHFEAFLYQALPAGDYSNLHDQIIGNIRGVNMWRTIFNKAWEVYRDERFAWVLNRVAEYQSKPGDVIPPWFRIGPGVTEFVRIEERDIPQGRFSFADDADISLTGVHRAGCSHFPDHGSTILRAEPDNDESLGAYVYWGPHIAGHRSPAALHLDIQAGGKRITHSPHMYKGSYADERHLTWMRSTIAHNTVTIDGKPMFPYDFDTDSSWETDTWRTNISDSELIAFEPAGDIKAVRVANENVYPGVRLDRTVAISATHLVDIVRVSSDAEHVIDLAAHVIANLDDIDRPTDAPSIDLGQAWGYRHFQNPWRHTQTAGWLTIPIERGGITMHAQLHLPADESMQVIVAGDPDVDERTPGGDLERPQNRTAIIRRVTGRQAVFVSVWSLSPGGVNVQAAPLTADGDVVVNVAGRAWTFPAAGSVACR